MVGVVTTLGVWLVERNMAELEETDGTVEATSYVTALDENEFHEAFEAFSDGEMQMSTANSVLIPFLKSLGLRVDGGSEIVSAIKDRAMNHTIQEDQLEQIVSQYVRSLKDPWPSHEDVLKAFQVFDSEGVGFIKVTMLKRFLVNAQLEVDDTNLERLIREHCQIDGDDLINYEDFIHSISQAHTALESGHVHN